MTSPNARLLESTFDILRRAVSEELRIDRSAIDLNTCLASVISLQGRRQTWQRLQQSLQLKLPSLTRPGWVVFLASVLIFIFAIAVLFSLVDVLGGGAIAVAAVAVIASWIFAAIVTTPFKTGIPNGSETFGSLAERVMRDNYARLNTRFDSWTSEGILEMVRTIVADSTGLPVDRVRAESSLMAEFSCGARQRLRG